MEVARAALDAAGWNKDDVTVTITAGGTQWMHAGRGIVLFHDTKAQTARMLPAFLRELKRRGFRVVHVVPEKAGGNSP